MAIRVTPLETVHDIANFDCGNADLNAFLREMAGQHQRKNISKTFVLIEDDAPAVVMGFYTLALRKMVAKEELPREIAKRLPREIPALSLARLAVRNDLKGYHFGEYLLAHALNRAARVADEIGGLALFVDAKDAQGAGFYKKYGFIPFPGAPLVLFMPFQFVPR